MKKVLIIIYEANCIFYDDGTYEVIDYKHDKDDIRYWKIDCDGILWYRFKSNNHIDDWWKPWSGYGAREFARRIGTAIIERDVLK